MKITKKQLRRLIETTIELSDKETAYNKSKEGLNESLLDLSKLAAKKDLYKDSSGKRFINAKNYKNSIEKLIDLINQNRENKDVDWGKELPLLIIESGLASDSVDVLSRFASIALFGYIPGKGLVKEYILKNVTGSAGNFIKDKINKSLAMTYIKNANPSLYSIFKDAPEPAFNPDGSLNLNESSISRRQLRRLIETTVFPKNPVDYVSDPEQKEKINTLTDSDDVMDQNMGYYLASMLQDEDGYEGEDYLADLKSAQNKDKLDQMYAMIPGLYQFSQSNKPFHDKFVNILLHPAGVELWLSLKSHNLQRLTDDDNYSIGVYKRKEIKNKINKLFWDFNNTEHPVLPDYLFTDPDRIWEGNIKIYALMSTINNDKSLWLTKEEWNKISKTLSELSGVHRMIVHFKILHFIHRFVKNTIEEIT